MQIKPKNYKNGDVFSLSLSIRQFAGWQYCSLLPSYIGKFGISIFRREMNCGMNVSSKSVFSSLIINEYSKCNFFDKNIVFRKKIEWHFDRFCAQFLRYVFKKQRGANDVLRRTVIRRFCMVKCNGRFVTSQIEIQVLVIQTSSSNFSPYVLVLQPTDAQKEAKFILAP